MERDKRFERIIGGDTEARDRARIEISRKQHERSGDKRVTRLELEPTEKEKEIFAIAQRCALAIARKYGGDPEPIALEKIRWLPPGGVAKITEGGMQEGVALPLQKEIALDRSASDLATTHTLMHELLHVYGKKAYRMTEEGDVEMHRSGISAPSRDNKMAWFAGVEEAIVIELSQRGTDEDLAHDSLLAAEHEKTEKVKGWLKAVGRARGIGDMEDRVHELVAFDHPDKLLEVFQGIRSLETKMAIFQRVVEEAHRAGGVHDQGYRQERGTFWKTVDRVVDAAGGALTREDVFTAFARCQFTGHYLPVARMVDKYLGSGTFRALAKETAQEIV